MVVLTKDGFLDYYRANRHCLYPVSQPASAEQETDFIIPKLHSYISTSTLSLQLHGLLFNCYTIHSVGADAITSKKIVRLLRSVFWHLALLISHQVGSDL